MTPQRNRYRFTAALHKCGAAFLLGVAALGFTPTDAQADTNFTRLSTQERQILGEEIRQVLLADPQIIARALAGPSPYEDVVEQDLSLIERLAPQLFDPARVTIGAPDATNRIAVFVGPNCPECVAALADLERLAPQFGVGVAVLDMVAPDGAPIALAAQLGLDLLPTIVFPDKILRGQMPEAVMQRYLATLSAP